MAAAIYIDFLQGIMTITFSFMLLPMIMSAVGGMDGLRQGLANTEMLSLIAPSEIGFFYLAVIALNGLVGIVTQPHVMGNCAAGRTELEGAVGFMGGNFLKRICTIPWSLIGVAAIVYFAGRTVHPDKVFGTVANEFLSKAMPGLLGIFIAGVVSSVLSTCSAIMLASSALLTENVYKHVNRNQSSAHYMGAARLITVLVVAAAVIYAIWLPGVVKGLEIFWIIASMMGIAFWLGLFWRKTTVAGAWAATIASFALWWLSTQKLFHRLPGQFLLGERCSNHPRKACRAGDEPPVANASLSYRGTCRRSRRQPAHQTRGQRETRQLLCAHPHPHHPG